MIEVTESYKPSSPVAEAQAVVKVTGTHTWDEVVDVGLKALGESRQSLFGYGIRGYAPVSVSDDTVTVYALRD